VNTKKRLSKKMNINNLDGVSFKKTKKSVLMNASELV